MKNFEFNKTFIPLNLQLFAEPSEPAEPTEPNEPKKPTEPTEPKEPPKTYTQEELEEIVKQRVAREKKATEKAVKEAEKLAKMNEEEKQKYQMEKMEKELEEYKKKDAFNALSKEASKMLSAEGIIADDEILTVIVRDDAENTSAAVKSFVNIVNTKAEEIVKQKLSGTPPRKSPSNPAAKNPFSKEYFNLTEQGKLYKENPELYKKLKAEAKK